MRQDCKTVMKDGSMLQCFFPSSLVIFLIFPPFSFSPESPRAHITTIKRSTQRPTLLLTTTHYYSVLFILTFTLAARYATAYATATTYLIQSHFRHSHFHHPPLFALGICFWRGGTETETETGDEEEGRRRGKIGSITINKVTLGRKGRKEEYLIYI